MFSSKLNLGSPLCLRPSPLKTSSLPWASLVLPEKVLIGPSVCSSTSLSFISSFKNRLFFLLRFIPRSNKIEFSSDPYSTTSVSRLVCGHVQPSPIKRVFDGGVQRQASKVCRLVAVLPSFSWELRWRRGGPILIILHTAAGVHTWESVWIRNERWGGSIVRCAN